MRALPLAGCEWHLSTASTNALGIAAAARGVPEIHGIVADVQTAGRGRRGRSWEAPAGSGLLLSLVVRPRVAPAVLPLLPLLTGLALAEAVAPFAQGAVALKWPNDLLLDGRKGAGILVEAVPDAAVVGIGLNLTWHPPGAAALGDGVDRWRVLAAVLGVFGNRYAAWQSAPEAFLGAYRARCATLGQRVRVTRVGAPPLVGTATRVATDGALLVDGERVLAGDVEHVRPAPPPAVT